MNATAINIDNQEVYTYGTISRRERQVLELIAYEYTAKEIAEELFVSIHTVVAQRKNLMEK